MLGEGYGGQRNLTARPGKTKTDNAATGVRVEDDAIGATGVDGSVFPRTATKISGGAAFRAFGVLSIIAFLVVFAAAPVPAPFPDVAAHIVQAEAVGGEAAYFCCLCPVYPFFGIGSLVLGAAIEIDLRRVGDILPIAKTHFLASLPGSVFPFRFGGEAVAIQRKITIIFFDFFLAFNKPEKRFLLNHFLFSLKARLKPFLLTAPIAVFQRIIPVHINHWLAAAAPAIVAWPAPFGSCAEGVIFLEGNCKGAQVEVTDGNRVNRLLTITTIPNLSPISKEPNPGE